MVYLAVPPLARRLEAAGCTVKDYFKPGKIMVPRPGGPVIAAGIVAGEMLLYLMIGRIEVLAIAITTAAGFAIGYADDISVRGGWFKPVALGLAGIPIILLGAYDYNLVFPPFGEVQIPVLYLGVIIMLVTIMGNAINSIDVINGAASGAMAILGFVLAGALAIIGSYEMALAALPLAFASLAYYRYHRVPCRIFPGDSGTLAWGAAYAAIAITGGVEIVAIVALLPAVINIFVFLSVTKRIVEHRKADVQPVRLNEDSRIEAVKEGGALPMLIRIIVAARPLTEAAVARRMHMLFLFSGALGLITAFLMVLVP